MRTTYFLLLLLLFVYVLPVRPAAGHAFHTSSAELEYNPQTERVEVSLKLHAVDLEQALSKLCGRKVNLEKDETNKYLTQYLKQNFVLAEPQPEPTSANLNNVSQGVTAGSDRSQVHIVGHELKATWCWIYFELELPAHYTSLALFNTVLFDVTEGQINTVSVRCRSERFSVKTTKDRPSSEFELKWLGVDAS